MNTTAYEITKETIKFELKPVGKGGGVRFNGHDINEATIAAARFSLAQHKAVYLMPTYKGWQIVDSKPNRITHVVIEGREVEMWAYRPEKFVDDASPIVQFLRSMQWTR